MLPLCQKDRVFHLSQRVSEGCGKQMCAFRLARNAIIESWQGLSWKGSETSSGTNPPALGRDSSR